MDTWLRLLDLDKNGLSSMVEANIRKNRQGAFRLTLTGQDGHPIQGAKMRVSQISHAFKFGANAFMAGGLPTPELNEAYLEVFRRTFNQAVLPFYWKDDEPEEGKFHFDKQCRPIYRRPSLDFMLDWCKEAGVEPKGHNIVWDGYNGTPGWL